jgi:hypothetical protein
MTAQRNVVTRKILDGPGEFDLGCLGLLAGQKVHFTIQEDESVGPQQPAVIVDALIFKLEAEDEYREKWLIGGRVLMMPPSDFIPSKKPIHLMFSGNYNSRNRQGRIGVYY